MQPLTRLPWGATIAILLVSACERDKVGKEADGSAGASDRIVVVTHSAGAGGASSAIDPAPLGGMSSVATTGTGGDCVPPASYLLQFNPASQQSTLLCWAGVAQMVATFFGVPFPSQCAELQRRNPADCGRNPSASCCTNCVGCQDSVQTQVGVCNYTSWPDFAALGLKSFSTEDGVALPLDVLKREIACHKRPVAFTWRVGAPNAGHIMIAYGYNGSDISIANPLEPCVGSTAVITYEVFQKGDTPGEPGESGTTSHWRDYYGFERIGP
jgi:hypothetical protein